MSETIQPKTSWSIAKWEITIAVSITLAAIILHILFLTHAGGLWRDEAGGVQLATLSSLGEVWHHLTHDSFPGLYVLLLRGWSRLGLGGSDFSLRIFGCVAGISLLGAIWWNARSLGCRTPLITLSLLACNLSMIRWGDSLRAYGVGCLLIVLSIGRMWSFVQQPTTTRFVVASLAALLSVQCLYPSAFLIAAICLAASLICFRRSRSRIGFLALLIGVPAALSLLPYLRPLKEAQKWWIVEKTGFNAAMIWDTLATTLDTPPLLGPVVWIGLVLVACFFGMTMLDKRVSRRDALSTDLPLFGALGIIGGTVGFFIFVVSAGLPTQPWYWLLLLTFLSVCLDAILMKRLARARVGLLIGIALFGGLSFATSLSQINCRMTNMDQLAARLTEQAGPEDVIVVYPWYCGVSFQRHYHGRSPWTTVPEVADHRFHRYDLLKVKLQETEPIRPVLERIQRTLSSGGKVWLVGGLPQPEPGEVRPPTLPPAPESSSGWYDEPYNYVWGRQLAHFLELSARNVEPLSIGETKCYTRFEKIPLLRISGSIASPLAMRETTR